MAGITLEQAQTNLDLWIAADVAVAANQSYSIDSGSVNRQLTRADAAEIRQHIDYWQGWVTRLSRSAASRRTRYIVTGC